jgi:glycosyltransferase involved in cell wall biosynthesis
MTYVLITPARNEADYIELTIQSMIAQTMLPLKWVIVSDGSTDNTDDIAKKYLPHYPWMELVRTPERKERHFAGKVVAFNAGYEKVNHLSYDIIGNLDADVSFDPAYFEFVLSKFKEDPSLGVAGTPYIEGRSHSFKDSYVDIHHVHGQIQIFRRQCFENINGYTPIKGGGIDWVAVTTARMKGWKTYSFQDKTFVHHRSMGTGGNGILNARFNYGQKNYYLGGHPLWHLSRSIFQMKNKPYLIGGILLLWGYIWAFITRMERPISKELISFYRTEQMQRLTNIFRTAFKVRSAK